MVRAAIVGLGRWGRNLVDAVQHSTAIRFTTAHTRTAATVTDFCRERGGSRFSSSNADERANASACAIYLLNSASTGVVLWYRAGASLAAQHAAEICVACSIAVMKPRAAKGLVRYATQPAAAALSRTTGLSLAVMKMIGRRSPVAASSPARSNPEDCPRCTSTMRQSAPPGTARARKSSADVNISARNPCAVSRRLTPLPKLGSSSTTYTTFFGFGTFAAFCCSLNRTL